jgi:NitT/TauT family transport system permease protein
VNGNSSLVRRGTAVSVALLVVFLAAWQWGPGLLGIPVFIIPPLSSVFDEFLRMLAVSGLMTHTGVTAVEVIAGFVLGSLLGAFFGYVLGMSPTPSLRFLPTSSRCRSRPRWRSRLCSFCGWASRSIRKSWSPF